MNVLPTGRNFYSVDPKALPSRLSWEVGQGLADDLLRRYLDEEGRYPESVGIVVWGTAAMRTQGDDVAEILALLGVRPTWNEESRRVTGLEVIPAEDLGRPRIDVTVRISGFFRDAFPNLISLMDEAVREVADLDEPETQTSSRSTPTRRTAPAPTSARSTTRIFGSKPGAYGAGLLPLIDARNWRDDEDLAEVYAVWGGYAYGKDLDGVEAREAMESNLRRTEIAVKNVDNREHDLFDSDDYFQYHGGMIAAVRALTGRNPQGYIGDSADPSRPKTSDLSEEARRVFRSRVANPKWIEAMQRHGYKGAFELSATVDYLFGYDATAGVVEDWMYRDVTRKYVLDESVRDFMQESNPWALRAIGERLLEAAERGLWSEPDPEDLDALKRGLPGERGNAGGASVRGQGIGKNATRYSLLATPERPKAETDDRPVPLLRHRRAGGPEAGPAAERRLPRGRRRPGARREGDGEVHRGASAGESAAADPGRLRVPVRVRSRRPEPRVPRRAAPEQGAPVVERPVRLVELPVGASTDRLTGTLDIERALTEGERAFEPGLLAAAHRGDPVRGRGEPALRPPRGPPAGRRGDGDEPRRARGRERAAPFALRPGRDDEPRGGRAQAAAPGPLRRDRGGLGQASTPTSASRSCAAGSATRPTRRAFAARMGRRPTRSSPAASRRPAPASPPSGLSDETLHQISACARTSGWTACAATS